MQKKEKFALGLLLGAVAVLVAVDVFGDSKQGVRIWHIFVESGIGFLALAGLFLLFRDALRTKAHLKQEKSKSEAYRIDAENWKNESRKYMEGLSTAIDNQLQKWSLTPAEREVAFLLLKGFSLKEIATIRNTAEKTARAHSLAIYAKSGLSGRAALSAFFLEDLLLP